MSDHEQNRGDALNADDHFRAVAEAWVEAKHRAAVAGTPENIRALEVARDRLRAAASTDPRFAAALNRGEFT
jgi:hypothetical protein